jgi:mitochondrial fission process protein 1
MSQSDAASEGAGVLPAGVVAETIVAEAVNREVDIWRDTYLRYLGYANEVGESFRPIFPKYVRPSYVIAFGYVGCDTLNKAVQSYREGETSNIVVRDTFDALLWQVLASVLLPGKIVHLITHSADLLSKTSSVQRCCPQQFRRFGPTALGLLSIPFIIHPIDNFVTGLLDATTRKWWK